MVYHIFNYCIQDVWYRDSTSCSDEHFDRTMCALDWKVPANIKIFHYGSPGPTPYELVNPVLLCRPILSIDPLALAEARIHQNVSVYDKHSHHVWPVLRRLDRFVIYQGANGWPRFSFVDGERLSIIAAMEVTPVTLKDALNFVRQNHRHCTAPQGHKYSIGIKASDTLIGVVIASTPKAMATVLENYYGFRQQLLQRMSQQQITAGDLWLYGEILYRIGVLETCQMYLRSAPITNEMSFLVGHYQMLDAYVQNLARERRYGPNRGPDTQKERDAAQVNLERVIQDYRKRFSGFQPAEPDAYQKEIGRVITTLLPAWLQYRNTFVPLQKNKKEEKRS